MPIPPYEIRQCQRQACGFRFPVTDGRVSGDICPRCGAPARRAAVFAKPQVQTTKGIRGLPEIEALLDNIRSIYNVGSMFRTADGAGVSHLHLSGITATPAHPSVTKTALGAESTVPWTYHRNGLQAAIGFKDDGFRLWAIEASHQSRPIRDAMPDSSATPIMLVVGNEICGVDPAILEQCDQVLRLPMQGRKQSLNVSVAFGIAVYYLRHFAGRREESPSV